MRANVNMVTCGGQATIPMVYAVARVAPVAYAEIVATVASASAGPGTRANIDEFTQTTARAVEMIGGAERGKAIIILNPADPPLIMRDTSSARSRPTPTATRSPPPSRRWWPTWRPTFPAIGCAPSRSSTMRPRCGGLSRVAIFLEVEGAGDFLPPYAGNLDIMTAAAARVGEEFATRILAERA